MCHKLWWCLSHGKVVHTHECTHSPGQRSCCIECPCSLPQMECSLPQPWLLSPFLLHYVHLTPFQRLTETVSDNFRNKGLRLTSAHSLKSWCAVACLYSAHTAEPVPAKAFKSRLPFCWGNNAHCDRTCHLCSTFSWAQSYPEPRPHSQPPLLITGGILHPTSAAEMQALLLARAALSDHQEGQRGRRNHTSCRSKLPQDLWNWQWERSKIIICLRHYYFGFSVTRS